MVAAVANMPTQGVVSMNTTRIPALGRTLPGILAFIALTLALALCPNPAHASCTSPANAIEAENCLPGTNSSVWWLDSSGDATIQGFATDISVNAGQTISFKIQTTARAYTIDVYRLGYYGGLGARHVASVTPSVALPQSQPACLTDQTTLLYDCGNWAVSASWAVPSTAVSGLYTALLTRSDTGGQSQIIFVVRNDASHSAVLFQMADETWQAYNPYGGHSLYGNASFDLTNRAYKVSYNRPLTTLDLENESWPFYDEYPLIRWLEANAYDITYIASVDRARNGALLKNHKAYLSVGHDEYVSGPERTSMEAARDAGVNLAFFSGNEVFWKTRWENSVDGTSTPYRTLVCYKETLNASSRPIATTAVDPQDPPTWTGTWADASKSPPADGGRPQNALTGQLFRVNGPGSDNTDLSIKVPAAQGRLRFWRNTQVAAQSAGQTWTLPGGTLGYEWDAEEDNGSRPAGLFDLSTATYSLTEDYLQDAGGLYGAGVATHHLSLYRAASGALVFGAGTVQWSWGLDSTHLGNSVPVDANMQQATVNLLADMNVQPGKLQAGLVAATASTDTIAPTSTITSPVQGATLHKGSPVTITGTATDSGGGIVAGVEVSIDDGATWHPATGTTSWTYTWVPSATGSVTFESRAVDDSANLETPSSIVTVNVGPPVCPCGLFIAQQPASPNVNDGASHELGMKFQAATPGQITQIRYWKAVSETGSHTGRIWSATGTPLASIAFSGETASGWQTQTLTTAVTIQANTTYVVSVNANAYYVATNGGLSSAVVNGNLSSVADGANGVFGTAGSFPGSSYQNTNYFRDVGFVPASNLTKLSGDNQVGTPGATLSNPLVVQVVDPNGNPLSGQTVAFNVTAGGGSVSPTSAVSNSNGQASTMLTLGASAGRTTVHATATGIGSVDFSAVTLQDTVLTTQSPVLTNIAEGSGAELGMKFQASEAGQITAIRYWKAANETGAHTGRIWSATGTQLVSVPFSGETASGWQIQALTSPLSIQANTTYVVSVNENVSYVATNNGLANPVVNEYLSSVADGSNGVYGTPSNFPTSSYQNTNYFRDVCFTNSPSLAKVSGDSQIGSPGTQLPKPLLVVVRDATASPVSGTTVTFGVTAGGGSLSTTSAVSDVNGQASTLLTLGAAAGTNTVQASAAGFGSVTFTATAVAGTLFTNQTPALLDVTEGTAHELGTKFQVSGPGQITAIRYWKAQSETGPHVGNIWSATGTLLTSVSFSGETASGWQIQALTSPLTIQANTTYVVSVNENAAYVATNSGLASPVVNGPLSSVADGANGVYGSKGAFPTSSYQNTNYFRDLSFVPQ
jgi:N,N-dimethylformamidase beta subunit-like, C-terminal/Domain of unknown function (DUF4082)/Bacterial Ig-like domain (group 1)/Bacterial Ig domain